MQMHLTSTSRNEYGGHRSSVLDTKGKQPEYETLLAAAREGQEGAFERLCEQASPRIFRTLSRITKNREDAEDALQEALMRAFINLGRFDGRSSFSTWLTRIALNAAFMKLRRSRLSREVALDGPDHFGKDQPNYQFRDHSPNPEDKYAAHERGEILRGALSELRPRVRAAVEIYQLQECSLKETAKLLGISVAAAKGRLFQAKAALRKASRTKTIGELRFRRAA
jgi:RNA polymerase sigma factor (sigma-70 family)